MSSHDNMENRFSNTSEKVDSFSYLKIDHS